MAKNKIAGNPEVDQTLPKIEIELGSKTYFLCFTFGALALAQSKLRAAGVKCNMLEAINIVDLQIDQIPPLLFAALLAHDPNLTFESVAGLITLKNLSTVLDKILEAYVASMADPSEASKGNPQRPE